MDQFHAGVGGIGVTYTFQEPPRFTASREMPSAVAHGARSARIAASKSTPAQLRMVQVGPEDEALLGLAGKGRGAWSPRENDDDEEEEDEDEADRGEDGEDGIDDDFVPLVQLVPSA